jgi:dimethylaniline monooxygenase (N-oxide forming)
VSGNEVRFVDGTTAEVDVIVHATGFALPTDFLPDDAQPDARRLFRAIVHSVVPGLYFVGLIEAHRALLPIAEAQAAWTAAALSGRLALPAGPDRVLVAEAETARRRRDFGDRRPYLIDHARYLATLRRDLRASSRERES